MQRGLLGVQWILARSLVHFERIAIPTDLPILQRQKALALKVRAGSPYASTSYVALWQGAHVQVWFWDRAKINAPRFARLIPESLMQPQGSQGLRLVAQTQGYEGQYWQEGELLASRYWPECPSLEAWLDFQRQAAVPAEQRQDRVAPEALPWLAKPYGRVQASERGQLKAQLNKIWLLVIALMMLWFVMLVTQHIKAKQRLAQLQSQVNQLTQKNAPLLAASQMQAADLTQIEALQSVLNRVNPLQVISSLLKIMPLDTTIQSYKQVDKTIKVVFNSKAVLNSAQIITKVQTLPYIASVTSGDAKEGQFELNIQLK